MEIDGLVLRVNQYRDYDAMVCVINERSSFSFLARGIRKIQSKNSFSVLPFAESHFDLMKTKDGLSLKTGSIIKSHSKLRDSFIGLTMFDFIGEVTSKFLLEKDYYKAYPSIKRIIELLESGFDHYTLAIIYLAFILNESGYGWSVDKCQKCGQKDDIVAINTSSGGFMCRDCFDGQNGAKLTTRLLKIIRYIFMVKPEMYDHIAFEKDECLVVLSLLEEFILGTVEFKLKSLKLLQN